MTYSVVARDPVTGELAVAVASCVLAVGRAVSWARAGVGAVATQSQTRRGYGPVGLDGLAAESPDTVLRTLLDRDPDPAVRQVAMVDADGRVAVHTGTGCLAVAGHLTGDGWSVQGNMLANPTVLPAMANAMTMSAPSGLESGGLAERLVGALLAGERAGGDLRGRQSAALLQVSARRTGEPWDEVSIDLRVDDSRDPLSELHRLLLLQRAYEQSDSATLALLGPDGPRDVYAMMEAARRGDLTSARSAFAQLRSRPGWEEWLRGGQFRHLAALLDDPRA
ncbi:DUF1028 domain-containing protein [Fodinicola acaciae]|uniref:DUF1028 domain-containing protein n=1 Tax=Fodinicola acaciae TaxID=2681555 RepID=UPI0013D1740A|nr:DUF1028 domain-containing protein [Fodinicola acaciae]